MEKSTNMAVAQHVLKVAADKVLDMQGRFVMGHPHANAEHDSALSRIAAAIRAIATPEGVASILERAKG